ncbi:MAG TPA: GNAT family N-acetyltransferase [Candidatus Sphingobacterium stercoripullorum]|uniref:GNAT family N-acetyltransferase n=1 Tax=Candidatus Sphingobacterium stercoripullorum TaxID=2838759 RepID=A0A9D2AXN5_9SPHI|nr:GNAT family N-acetyltransferase [Candidatus Sphingobacterium stercoripullorum]
MVERNVLNIRMTPVNDSGLEKIKYLAYKIWPEVYIPIIGEKQVEFMLSERFNKASLQKARKAGEEFYVLEIDSVAVGFLGLRQVEPEKIRIEKWYLTKEVRGKGLGKSSFLKVREIAGARGVKKIELNVHRSNPAFHFYRTLGFQVSQEVDIPYFEFVLTDFVMEYNLDLA